jgi:hypothetical protein
MTTCSNLSMKGVGLEDVHGIQSIFPNLQVLDITDNKIVTVDTIDTLAKIKDLAELNILNNPIMIHANINQMILEEMPNIEVVNELSIKDAGQRYKETKE